MTESKRGRGRPKSDNPKNKILACRMTKEERKMVSDLSEKSGLTESEVVHESLELYVEMCKFKDSKLAKMGYKLSIDDG